MKALSSCNEIMFKKNSNLIVIDSYFNKNLYNYECILFISHGMMLAERLSGLRIDLFHSVPVLCGLLLCMFYF